MSSGRRGKQPSPLSASALRQLIRVALEKGYYTESLHHPERNISIDDVIHGVEWDGWTLMGSPQWFEDRGCYRYRIRTVDIEGDELTIIIAAFPGEKRVGFITAW